MRHVQVINNLGVEVIVDTSALSTDALERLIRLLNTELKYKYDEAEKRNLRRNAVEYNLEVFL